MQVKELLSSGIIEMYCLGLASDEEKLLVEELATTSKEVRDEIAAVNEALHLYAQASMKSPAHELKNKILNAVNSATIAFPPELSKNTTVEEWNLYLSVNKISPPSDFEMAHIIDLPGNNIQVTYVAWAKKGAVVEESHDDEDEYLFMLKGNCSVTLNGRTKFYKEGELIFIPKKTVHRAEALSDDMILVGQRVAA